MKKERQNYITSLKAGVQGFEPRLADPESAVLPLNDTPMCRVANIILSLATCQAVFGACNGACELLRWWGGRRPSRSPLL